jgi:aminoglycoside/choline kinase family phosphotransferase
MRVPQCYFSDLDSETDDFVLLLEDLSDLEQADQLHGLSPERAVLSCEYIARLHGRFWQRTEGFDWIPPHGETGYVSLLVAGLHAGWPQFVGRFGRELPPEALRVGERVVDALPTLMESSPREPVTVIHGDYRADNIFFGPPTSPDRLVVFDWQTTRIGRGAYDLAYFLCESVTPTTRRACELRCLGAWHAELVRRGVSSYTLEDARSDYLRSVLTFVAISVLSATFMDADDQRAVAHLRAIVDRAFAAALDLRAETVIPS